MKLQLTFKTPDVLDQIESEIAMKVSDLMLSTYDLEDLEKRAKKEISKWLQWNEIIIIEFDLDNQTAKVVEKNG